MIVGKEVGDEGTPHHQGYVSFKKKMTLIGCKRLLTRAHWAQIKGTPWENFVYCSKDGDFTETGSRPKAPKGCKDDTYSEALAAPTVAEGMDVIKKKQPRDYCLHGEAIERNLKRAKLEPFTHLYTEFTREVVPLNKSLLIYGSSNTGKTHFACHHFKNPLVVSHIDKLKHLSPDNDGIVFDDMSFKHWPVESVIHLLDAELSRDINVRYGTVTIPARVPKIFTHNHENPFYNEDISDDQRAAIERRLTRCHVHNKLYTSQL